MTIDPRPTIKSFVLRQGRLTPGQKKALDELWPKYGLEIGDSPCDPAHLFSENSRANQNITFEIGFGMGESLIEQAIKDPDHCFIGVEVHRPGQGHFLLRAHESDLKNVKIFGDDSIAVLTSAIVDESLDCIQVFFPDPWHKKRHHKRRIINASFLALAHKKLKIGGLLHVATDWLPYAQEIAILLEGAAEFSLTSAPARPKTKFERRGERLGHEISDIAYQKQAC